MVLRISEVVRRLGISKTTLWRMERRGVFPARIRLSEQSVGWLEADIDAWLASRPRGMTNAIDGEKR